MTIEIAVRTGTAVVFAADSKVTTSGIEGIQEDGSPLWLEQTYDNATKVVHDRSRTLMAMAAGHANVGRLPASDVIARMTLPRTGSNASQDTEISALVKRMVEMKSEYWKTTDIPADQWPGPTLLLAAPSPDGETPRVWQVKLAGAGSEMTEILTDPGLKVEGSYDEVFALLYGIDSAVIRAIRQELGVSAEKFREALANAKVLRPIDKINFWAMPTQEAVDLAVFLAGVQCQMDRFLPGTPACGGPIDVMVLQMAPEPVILPYPGKVLHHPHSSGVHLRP
ncbi:MAG: hypothetical protein HYU51_15960 [Candidatus Rokubacteria bacterium]|nr:hypothetical protein [Candidatus Rokubacteria bacterium]